MMAEDKPDLVQALIMLLAALAQLAQAATRYLETERTGRQ
jgi:hypothetical protein